MIDAGIASRAPHPGRAEEARGEVHPRHPVTPSAVLIHKRRRYTLGLSDCVPLRRCGTLSNRRNDLAASSSYQNPAQIPCRTVMPR